MAKNTRRRKVMSDYLGIKPLPFEPPKREKKEVYELCARPGHNIITHCIEEEGHEGTHTYAPVPDDAEKPSDRLEQVMRLLVQTCPDYQVGDFVTPKPLCCIYHAAAATVTEVQETLRRTRQ